MTTNARSGQQGFSILETIIGMGIFVIVSTSLYLAYSNTLDIVTAGEYHSAAANIIESEVEAVRNMRYEDIGVVGGVPAGLLPATKSVMLDGTEFLLRTFVRNIDDPFDGTLGGTPSDASPTDYKLVEFHVECATCARFTVIRMTTTVAPRNLENETKTGALIVTAVDASGQPLSGASVAVSNSAVFPAINLTDTTDVNGQLTLIGLATSSAHYRVTVSRNGYSTDRTYPPDHPSNPNPTSPDITIAQEQLSEATFSIDQTGSLTFSVTDPYCTPLSGFDLLLTGGKLIGTSPNIPKYSQTHSTNAGGTVSLSGMEWDAYSAIPTGSLYDVAATSHTNPLILAPAQSMAVSWVAQPRAPASLMVRVTDPNGTLLNGASLRLSSGSYDATLESGQFMWSQENWSGGAFSQQSGGIETPVSGSMMLLAPYATGSYEWLESETIDLGTSNTSFGALSWTPTSQPPEAGAQSVRLQVAYNNDAVNWNYVGPDGTEATYFTTSDTALPSAADGNRYIRYRTELQTLDADTTPVIEQVSLGFRSDCTPGGAALFTNIPTGTYSLTVTLPGFTESSETDIPVLTDWQSHLVELVP